jgi:hypothetical protein
MLETNINAQRVGCWNRTLQESALGVQENDRVEHNAEDDEHVALKHLLLVRLLQRRFQDAHSRMAAAEAAKAAGTNGGFFTCRLSLRRRSPSGTVFIHPMALSMVRCVVSGAFTIA